MRLHLASAMASAQHGDVKHADHTSTLHIRRLLRARHRAGVHVCVGSSFCLLLAPTPGHHVDALLEEVLLPLRDQQAGELRITTRMKRVTFLNTEHDYEQAGSDRVDPQPSVSRPLRK